MLAVRPEIGVLRGIRDGPSSVLSRDKLEPWRLGGLLPGRLPVLEVGLEFDRESPGVRVDLYEDLRGVLYDGPSVSDKESGVPADKLDFDDRGKLLPDIGIDFAERSLTLVIGPCDVRKEVADEPEAGDEADVFGLNAVMD